MGWTRRLAWACAVFAVAFAVYRPGRVSEGYNLADPLLIVPTSLSLLQDHDLELGEYASEVDPEFYGLLRIDGRPYNRYPIGASLVALPFVWLADAPAPGERPLAYALRIAGPVAKALAALAVALLFLLILEVDGRLDRALALAAVFAFATPHFPIHAGGLWTHNALTPLVLIALLLLVVRDGRFAAAAAVPLAMAFATRPTSAPVIACLSLHVARRHPRAFRAYATVGGVGAALFVAWSWYMYGSALPPYYLGFHNPKGARITPTAFSAANLVGNLVSPNRGLLVFAPVLAFSLWGMGRALRSEDRHASLYRAVALAVVVHWVMISTMRGWWAGWSFGPRNFMDVLPLLVLLLVPAWDGLDAGSRATRRLVVPAGAAALAWSLFVAVRGATSFEPHEWNRTPVEINRAPARVWDWGDMQILRGLTAVSDPP